MGRVRGVVDRDDPGAGAAGLQFRHQLLDGVGVTGDHHRPGAVDGGDRQPAVPPGQLWLEVVHGQRDRGHATASSQCGDGPAAQGDDPGGVVQGQGTGHVGGGDLPLAVADDGMRMHAVRAPQRRERDEDRPQRGLHHVDAVQRGCLRRPAQDVEQVPVDVRAQRPRAVRDRRGEHRGGLEQARGHAGPLGALAGEDEHGPAVRSGGAPGRVRRQFAPGQRLEGGEEAVPVAGDDNRAFGERRAGGVQRRRDVRDVRDVRPRPTAARRPGAVHPFGGCLPGGRRSAAVHRLVRAHPRRQPGGLPPQPLRGFRGQRPRHRRAAGLCPRAKGGAIMLLPRRRRPKSPGWMRCRRAVVRGLFDDRMGVGAADAEGGDPRPAGTVERGPRPGLGEQFDLAGGPVHIR